MSGNKISTNMTDLKNLGKQVEDNGAEYLNEAENIYKLMDELNSEWKGQDASGFVNKAYDDRPHIESLGKLICNYGLFLQQTSDGYTRVQEHNVSAIKKGGGA